MTLNLQDFLNLVEKVISQINPTLALHHVRTAYIALQLSNILGLSKNESAEVFIAAWLHDVGVTTKKERNIVFSSLDNDNKEHEKQGALLLSEIEIFKAIAPIVKNHHLNKIGYDDIDLKNKIIHISDRFELITRRYSGCLAINKDGICQSLLSEHFFIDSYIKNAIYTLKCKDYFWFALDSKNLLEHTIKNSPVIDISIPPADFLNATSLIGYIIDRFSGFTHIHSHSVGDISNLIALNLEFSSDYAVLIHSAGFLHDIGKLCVPPELLEKKGALTSSEYTIVRQHSFRTMEMFVNSPSLRKIGLWASQHHERMDGSGYPFGLKKDELEFESKIIMVADIFTAMIEPRPYKNSKTPSEAIHTLKQLASNNKIPLIMINILEENLQQAVSLVKFSN